MLRQREQEKADLRNRIIAAENLAAYFENQHKTLAAEWRHYKTVIAPTRPINYYYEETQYNNLLRVIDSLEKSRIEVYSLKSQLEKLR